MPSVDREWIENEIRATENLDEMADPNIRMALYRQILHFAFENSKPVSDFVIPDSLRSVEWSAGGPKGNTERKVMPREISR